MTRHTLPYLNGKVGIIGYCSGGRQVYLAACTLNGIDAAVDCYGGGVAAPPEELNARQPVAPIDYFFHRTPPVLNAGISGRSRQYRLVIPRNTTRNKGVNRE